MGRGSVVALLACALAWSAPFVRADDGLAGVRSRGVLRWGGDVQGGEPYVFTVTSVSAVNIESPLATPAPTTIPTP